MNLKVLLVADADKIQSYLFESVKLKEIAGASLIIKEFNEKIKKVLENHPVLKSNGINVVYSRGGVIRLSVCGTTADEAINHAKIAKEIISREYQRTTKNGTISFSDPILEDEIIKENETSFQKATRKAEQSLRKNKQKGGRLAGVILSWPYLQHCSDCGLRPAAESRFPQENESEELLCESCLAKLAKRQFTGKDLFYEEINSYYLEKTRQSKEFTGPDDFDQVGLKSIPQGYIGLIVADGNRMGEKLAGCSDETAFESVSKAIENALTTALKEAIFETYGMDDHSIREHYNDYLPLQVLVKGGDDLVILTTAQAALPLAARLCRRFSEIGKQEFNKEFSMSAGVVLAKSNLPFLISHRLAEGLAGEAKKLSFELLKSGSGEIGCVDFQVITASNALEISQIRDNLTLKDPENESSETAKRLLFTGRPYTVEGLEKLIEAVAGLIGADFPRSQLTNLLQILNPEFGSKAGFTFQGICDNLLVEYLRFKKRLRSDYIQPWKTVEQLPKLIHSSPATVLYADKPTNIKPHTTVILYPDILEVYPFIATTSGETERSRPS